MIKKYVYGKPYLTRSYLKDFKEDDYQKEDTSIEDNLFDLIDSMYDEKKGE